MHFVDTDASGFAHFSVYVRMMEETEYAFLRSRGLCVVLYDDFGTMGFPRLSVSINIFEPLVLGQEVRVRLRLTDIDGKRLRYEFEIMNEDDVVAVEGKFCVASCRFPDGDLPFAILTPDYVIEALQK